MKQKLRIAIVSRYFFPENTPRSFRTTELATELHKQGHDVTLWIPNLSERSLEEFKHFAFAIKDLGTLKWKDISLKGPFRLFKRILKRFMNLFLQFPEIELMYKVKAAMKRETGFDLLITIAMPHTVHWGVAAVWDKQHPIAKVWVADCGDPFMGQENDTFKPPFYFGRKEKDFCQKAHFITVPIEGAKDAYYPEFRDKIKVIPQGFDFNAIQFHKEYTPNQIPIFGYAGMFIPGIRDPRECILYLQSLPGNFEFHIYTKTPAIIESVLSKDEKRIILHPPVAREKVLQHLATMDFVVNFENAGGRQLPSKLIDYAIVKRPVISIKTGQLSSTIIDQFLSGDYSGQMNLGDMERYRIENVARQFIQLFNDNASA